jgi:transcriptional regulator with XRE-family HTH domain
MMRSHPASYLRSHRKRSGLTQKEIATLLGYLNEGEISRHERLCSAPPFRVALGYEAVFRVPISVLFREAFESTKRDVEARLGKLTDVLRQSTATGRQAALIARKLEWMWERKNQARAALFPHDGPNE